MGIYYFSGTSTGINGNNTSINNQIDEYRYGTVQLGLYTFLNLHRDSSVHVINYLRLDIGYGNRAGAFDLGNGGVAKMSSSSIDFTPMLPFRFRVIKGVDAYAMLGPVFSYRLRRTIVTNQSSLPSDATTGSAFKFGYGTELGFRIGNCTIGFRVMSEVNDYPTRISAVCLGFSPPNSLKKSK